MNKKKQIIMSAASVSAALSAIATSSADEQILDTPKSTAYDAAALEAINTARSQVIIKTAMPQIARTIRVDDDLMASPYAKIAGDNKDATYYDALELASTVHLKDSTTDGGDYNCYGNCHSACHGSRGWR